MSSEYSTESVADVYGDSPRAIDAMPSVGEAVWQVGVCLVCAVLFGWPVFVLVWWVVGGMR